MTAQTLTVIEGDRIVWNDETYTVRSVASQYAILQNAHGNEIPADIAQMVTDGMSRADSPTVGSDAAEWLDMTGLDEAAVQTARDWLPHIREIETGYQSGDPNDALPHEPRPEYDPDEKDLTQGQRIASKSLELRAMGWKPASERTVYRRLQAYQKSGVRGMVNKNNAPRPQAPDEVKRQALIILNDLIRAEKNASTGKRNRLIHKFQRRIREEGEELGLSLEDLPTERQIYNWIKDLRESRYTFSRATTRKNQEDKNGELLVSITAPAPGWMQIDKSGCDVRLVDHLGKPISAEVILLFDIFTRMIVGHSIVINAKAVDCADLLRQAIEPPAHIDGYDKSLAFNMNRLGREPLVPLHERLAGDLARPPIPIQRITVDNEAVFVGNTFTDACAYLEIDLHLARLARGQDKGVAERGFGTFGSEVAQFSKGHTGGSPVDRADDVDDDATYKVSEFDARVAEWVYQYNRTPHSAHQRDDRPAVSPIEKYEEWIAGAGMIVPHYDPELYFNMLNPVQCAYNRYGAEVQLLTYDSKEFQSFRGSLTASKKTKANVRWDPHDRSRIWWKDPRDNKFKVMWCKDMPDDYVPFSDDMVREAVRNTASDGRREKNALILRYVSDFRDGLLDGELTPSERAARMDYERTRQADERQAGTPADTLTEPEWDNEPTGVVLDLSDRLATTTPEPEPESDPGEDVHAEGTTEQVSADVLDMFR